jgi:acyl-CoA synthetase (AMP-forming)/AMP-acid ligase II
MARLSFFEALAKHDQASTAIATPSDTHTYAELLNAAQEIKDALTEKGNAKKGDRISILAGKNIHYAAGFLGVWLAGCIAVPLCTSHPIPELQYTVEKTESSVLLVSKPFAAQASGLCEAIQGLKLIEIEPVLSATSSPDKSSSINDAALEDEALIIMTSGSTGKPKGGLHTHGSLLAQICSLKQAWSYEHRDVLLHVLPLHHIHGIVNAFLTVLYAGGCVEFADEKFNTVKVWQRLRVGRPEKMTSTLPQYERPITLFMAVPTIYTKLLAAAPADLQASQFEHLELCVSGSAALPSSVKQQWQALTGHVLLERYGMTEIGMALSCGLVLKNRLDSSVGWPLPGIQAKLVDSDTGERIDAFDTEGEIWIAGEQLFKGYYNQPEQTAKEIVIEDGVRWFKTGDVAIRSEENRGAYYIHGRSSVDILKSGGYKLSALQVERDMLEFLGDKIKEVAVIGVADAEWGQKVAAIATPQNGQTLTLKELRDEMKKHIAPYKIPQALKLLKEGIPRNAMGKVNKKDLIARYEDL